MTQFKEIIKNEKLLRAIDEMGYNTPTEIQEKAIPLVLARKDIIAKSNTGTGKTASFGLPMLQMICEGEVKQVLIVCPTRELVTQVEDELRKFSKFTEFVKIASVFGGTPIDRQIRTLKKGVQIIVGTPGRILDHIRRRTIKLKNYDCVILDEADEMLNMGFRDDIETILNKIEGKHQTILFSATMPKAIREIATGYLHDQVEIEIKSQYKTVETINQVYYDLKKDDSKSAVIKQLLSFYSPNLTLIFCNTKANVDDLVDDLNRNNIKAIGLHGDVKQDKRTKIMANFKKSKKAILVASDVAARGIDVNNIDLVINHDLPQDNEVYVHRIGRTGRAGKNGLAITLVKGRKQWQKLQNVMKFTKASIDRKEIPSKQDIEKMKKQQFRQQLVNLMDAQEVVSEHMKFTDELLDEGYSKDAIISGLLALHQGGEISNSQIPSSKRRKKKLKHGVELKLTIGSENKVSINDIETSIVKESGISLEQIGTIDIRKRYSIVVVEKKAATQVLNEMISSKINEHTFNVRFYKKEKLKDLYN